jgi:hypothetical protein
MQPLGNHIEISNPETIGKSSFIVEKEFLTKAKVLAVSPDITVPFIAGSTVFFYTDREIYLAGKIYLNIEMIPLYCN